METSSLSMPCYTGLSLDSCKCVIYYKNKNQMKIPYTWRPGDAKQSFRWMSMEFRGQVWLEM